MKYLLITSAKNEERYIPYTINSVVKQSILPEAWMIISDGSNDRTDVIIQEYAATYRFIKYFRMGEDEKRNFKSKALAINKGYELIKSTPHDYIGILDADISFDADYFKFIISHMESDASLGIGGGIILELINGKYVPQKISTISVAGAVQFFRRECFKEIGGYKPLCGGGEDAAGEITARSKGWKVQTFKDLEVRHHRRVISGSRNAYSNSIRHGISCYLLGYHPVFHVIACLSKVHSKPIILGSFLAIMGYFWACAKRHRKELPEDVISFLRKEQIARLLSLTRRLRAQSSNTNMVA
jgi:glycosyltransferase involved in cell wall biosynthesis